MQEFSFIGSNSKSPFVARLYAFKAINEMLWGYILLDLHARHSANSHCLTLQIAVFEKDCFIDLRGCFNFTEKRGLSTNVFQHFPHRQPIVSFHPNINQTCNLRWFFCSNKSLKFVWTFRSKIKW